MTAGSALLCVVGQELLSTDKAAALRRPLGVSIVTVPKKGKDRRLDSAEVIQLEKVQTEIEEVQKDATAIDKALAESSLSSLALMSHGREPTRLENQQTGGPDPSTQSSRRRRDC